MTSSNYPKPIKRAFGENKITRAYSRYWEDMINLVVDRDTYNKSHLYIFSNLCATLAEIEHMEDILSEKGQTYSSHGRSGDQIKLRPERDELVRLRKEAVAMSKELGLLQNKNSKVKAPIEGEEDFD